MPKRKATTAAPRSASPLSPATGLILIDGAPTRKKARQSYEKASRDLREAREQMNVFNGEDRPAYDRWLHSQFGALLTHIREATQRLHFLRGMVDEVEMEVFYHCISFPAAYRRVKARLEMAGAPEGSEGEPFDPEEQQEDFAGSFSKFFEEFSSFFQGQRASGQEESFHQRLSSCSRKLPKDPGVASRLKELYRALVRRLHPDTCPRRNAQSDEWWHLTQSAYGEGNLEQLEVIWTLCEIDAKGKAAQPSISLLMRITAQLRKTLRALRRELKRARQDPAWGFSRRADHLEVARALRVKLESQFEAARERVSQLEALIARWERPANGRTDRKRKAMAGQSLFF